MGVSRVQMSLIVGKIDEVRIRELFIPADPLDARWGREN
jgi:hypothetical protein